MDAVSQLIGTLGFPIVACIALFYMCYYLVTNMKDVINENTQTIAELRVTIENLSAIIIANNANVTPETISTEADTEESE